MFFTLLVVYVVGGLTFIPVLILAAAAYVYVYEEPRPRQRLEPAPIPSSHPPSTAIVTLKTWLTVRKSFEASPQTYISMVRTLLDSRSANSRRAEDAYLAVLKGNVLYLYEDEAMQDCAAAIDVKRCKVRVHPEAGLLDGELFAKRNALLIASEGNKNDETAPLVEPWYMFFKSVSVMEDWYLALLAVQHDTPPPYPLDAHASLLSSLDALPDLIPTRWLNALLGRLFLAVKGTTAVEAWVIARLMKKLSKVKKPGFLKNVVVRSFEAGDVAPVLSKPMLKELTPDGEAGVGVDVSYTPPPGREMRITVSAIATISLPGASFSLFGKNKEKDTAQDKPYEVSLVLAIVVRKVVGNMLVKIKRPPSNRLWYAFTTMPQMEISIEPVVSDRQVRWGMVLSVIENKLKEIIQESVVLPYMDDVPFFDTSAYPVRGGIFQEAFVRPATTTTTTTTTIAMGEKITTTRDETSVTVEGPIALAAGGDASAPVSDAESDGGVLLTRVDNMTAGNVRQRRMWFGKKGQDSGSDGARVSEDESAVNVIVDSQQGKESPPRGRPELGIEANVTTRRAHSQAHSRPSSPTPSSSGLLSRSAPSSTPSSPPPGTNTSPAATFLQNLKSRGAVMAEKQPALKEAMRKWGMGVNWATNLRKNEKGAGRERGRDDDDWEAEDHNELWHGTSGKGSRGGASYVDLKKKVEEREKDKQRMDESWTMPIDIPSGGSRRVSKQTSSSRSDSASPPAPSSPRRISPPTSGQLFPSAPRTTIELQTDTARSASPTPSSKEKGSADNTEPGQSHSTKSTSLPASTSNTDTPTRAPIRAQPPKPAPMMTIPGIHASHRGEVMALGSQPAAELGETRGFEKEKDSYGPKPMQSVYKLLRGEQDASTSSILPPPLPPRSPSMGPQSQRTSPSGSVLPSAPETNEQSSDEVSITSIQLTPPTPPAATPLSPASQALKNVVQHDTAAALPRKTPPPLPVRRPVRQSTASSTSELQNTSSPPPPAATTTAGHALPIAGEKWTPPIPLPPRREMLRSPSSNADG